MKQPLHFFLPFLPLLSNSAQACSACTLSLVHLFFPFLWEGTVILIVWRMAYLGFQKEEFEKQPVRFVLREVFILGVLYLAFWKAFLFVYGLGYFLYALGRAVILLAKRQNLSRGGAMVGTQVIALMVLYPFALEAYAKSGRMDTLDLFRAYVLAGTGQSRVMVERIAEDADFDVRRLAEMIRSRDPDEFEKAAQILHKRSNPADAVVLKESLLTLSDGDLDECGKIGRSSTFLRLWLEKVAEAGVHSKEELEGWIESLEETFSDSGYASSSSAEAQIFHIPEGRDVYFRKNLRTQVEYIHLRSDGAYRIYVWIDLGGLIHERDNGTWIQNASGEVILTSARLFHAVSYGPLTMPSSQNASLDGLKKKGDILQTFLNSHEEQVFSRVQIEKILERDFPYGVIRVNLGIESVSRESLVGLNQAIAEFLASETKNHFLLIPKEYQSWVYLVWRNAGTPIDRNEAEIRESLEKIRQGRKGLDFFVKISKSEFDEEVPFYTRVPVLNYFQILLP